MDFNPWSYIYSPATSISEARPFIHMILTLTSMLSKAKSIFLDVLFSDIRCLIGISTLICPKFNSCSLLSISNLIHLNKWQLHPSTSSDKQPRSYPWLVSFSHIPHMVCQRIFGSASKIYLESDRFLPPPTFPSSSKVQPFLDCITETDS